MKAEYVEKMFNSIAGDYDRLNHILSLNIDKLWRRRSLRYITDEYGSQSILDIACGTGDFTIDIARSANPLTTIIGMDLSEGMLEVMKTKLSSAGLDERVSIIMGNCESMDFPDGSFDRVTVGFGIRNFEHREAALKEVLRVLKPGGRFVMLELSVPSNKAVRAMYKLYFTRILPRIGGKISGDVSAYKYLPASVLNFPGKTEWMKTMSDCGFRNVKHKAYTMGICRMYIGEK